MAEAKAEQGPMSLDDLPEEAPQVTLRSGGDPVQTFVLPAHYIQLSGYVRKALEGHTAQQGRAEIPVLSVDGPTLARVVQYLEHHAGEQKALVEKPLRSKRMLDVVKDPWDAEFMNQLSTQETYDVIQAANYMDINCLLHLGCATVASWIKGEPLEKIKTILDPNSRSEPSPGVTSSPECKEKAGKGS